MTRRFRIADTAIPGAHAQIWIEEGTCATGTLVRREEDAAGPVIVLPREWLVEVKPPSIDDPVSLPLNIFCTEDDGSVHLEADGSTTTLWVRVRGEFIDHAGGVFDYSDSTLHLKPLDLRDLARAAWQRADALEAGEATP